MGKITMYHYICLVWLYICTFACAFLFHSSKEQGEPQRTSKGRWKASGEIELASNSLRRQTKKSLDGVKKALEMDFRTDKNNFPILWNYISFWLYHIFTLSNHWKPQWGKGKGKGIAELDWLRTVFCLSFPGRMKVYVCPSLLEVNWGRPTRIWKYEPANFFSFTRAESVHEYYPNPRSHAPIPRQSLPS